MTILINNIKKLSADNNEVRARNQVESSYTEKSLNESKEDDDYDSDEEDESYNSDEEDNEGGCKENSNSSQSPRSNINLNENFGGSTFRKFVTYNDNSLFQDGGSSENESEEDEYSSEDEDHNQNSSSTNQDNTESEEESASISEFNNKTDNLNTVLNSKIKLK